MGIHKNAVLTPTGREILVVDNSGAPNDKTALNPVFGEMGIGLHKPANRSRPLVSYGRPP